MAGPIANDVLTRSVEDYLKAIYRLTEAGQPAGTSDIAHLLDLSAPSVSGMVKRLAEQGLLQHHPYKGVSLTDDGRRAALRTIRRHRIIEAYLVGFLAYDWDTVHDEAELLEHAVSDRLIDRMAEALGNPRVDPHGDPIPTADGRVEARVSTPLPLIPVGETVTVLRVVVDDPDRLRYLASLGLKPGVGVQVTGRQPFNGPTTIIVGGVEQIVGHELAGGIFCGTE